MVQGKSKNYKLKNIKPSWFHYMMGHLELYKFTEPLRAAKDPSAALVLQRLACALKGAVLDEC